MTRRFTFIGVTTPQSAVMTIFPRWLKVLGLGDMDIVGRDVPLHAARECYRAELEAILDDPDGVGGLVTTHKIDLYLAARDLFDQVDDDAQLLDEVSAIRKQDGRLLGWATDSISSGRTLQSMLGPDYFRRTGGHVLLLGAGGAALAILLYLLRDNSADPPGRIVVTDRHRDRLDRARALYRELGSTVPLSFVLAPAATSGSAQVSRMPPCSLIINATGMGKDTPGSPLTDAVRLPRGAVAWDLNYRGDLGFLWQARRQPVELGVRVEDGWEYFINGWAAVMEKVFARTISPAEITAMAEAAESARPAQPIEDRTGSAGV